MQDVGPNRPVVFADSVTRLDSSARGAVVVCGSHGGLLSAVEALHAGVAALIVHDAAVGCDAAGIAAMTVLDRWGLPCAAVDYLSARIGDAADCGSRGVLSHVNTAADRLGLRKGQRRCCVDRSGGRTPPTRCDARDQRQRARSSKATRTRAWTGTSTVIS